MIPEALAELEQASFAERLQRKDPTLWKPRDPSHQKIIRRSLGWLDLPRTMPLALAPARRLAAHLLEEGFGHVVVLGMGGSSLSCEVFRSCLPAVPGRPRLLTLDSTHPDAVAQIEAAVDLRRTFFIVSSKSGSTIEPNCLMAHFLSRAGKLGGKAGARFAAITDPGTSMEKTARRHGFLQTFINPPDVGGRFSALSLFGLVPAAAMGADPDRLLLGARQACVLGEGLRLGAFLGGGARRGRDKMVLDLGPELESLGLWVEQLIAESTGKEGRGILPVRDAAAGTGTDRMVVRILGPGRPSPAQKGGSSPPVFESRLDDPGDLGREFLRWEIATAAAGWLLGVNPFDQPDVQSAKDRTQKILAGGHGRDGVEKASFRAGNLPAYCDPALSERLKADPGIQVPLERALAAHAGRRKARDYWALLSFLGPDPRTTELVAALRRRLARRGAAVAFGAGPRYLHSTGQLFKGGPPTGVFLLLRDAAAGGKGERVPGETFGFRELVGAQGRGDFSALLAAGRRVLRLDLSRPREDLRAILKALG